MNREIKFRGKKTQTNEWVYGSLILSTNNQPSCITAIKANPVSNGILNYWCFGVETNSIGEYTGLKDKNGKEIYEDDIVCANGSKTILVKDNSDARRFVSHIFKDEYKSEKGRFNFQVYWQDCFSGFAFKSVEKLTSINTEVNSRDYEVIGNIYENPELLNN